MVVLPLVKKLKKSWHREIALAQDILIQEIFSYFKTAVLHSGTAIWRCYNGNRFSEDVDIYLSFQEKNKINQFLKNLENLGFKILKKKFTQNAFYSKLEYEKVTIRFEVLFKKIKNFTTKEYENLDGTKITVYTLPPEILIEEKIGAYSKRKMIRDLYDIYFLLDFVENINIIKNKLKDFLENFKDKKPQDEKELKFLIISGVAPKFEEIIKKIEKNAQS